jgi:DNA-binding transcriptional MerR regulator
MAVTVSGNGHPAGSMRIGQVARRSGFTVKALRFYEAMGLLPPSSRSAGGYRLYDEPDLHRLEFIRQAKTLGLALDEIRELVVSARSQSGGTTRARLGRLLAERIAQTRGNMDSLSWVRR